jgi:hypothetical protein
LSDFDVAALQRGLNAFTKKYARGMAPIRVDGSLGKSTRARVRTVKYLLGYRGKINSTANVEFRERMWHPKSTKYSTPARIALGAKRRSAQRANYAKTRARAAVSSGLTKRNGVVVAAWMAPYIDWAKQDGWPGWVVSGYRDPAYSDSLCRRMCGAPSCPGRCAGRNSNHSGKKRPQGALDVAHYADFGQRMRRCPLQPRIFNALGVRDPVHFSASGN